jgi:hypothetical protein
VWDGSGTFLGYLIQRGYNTDERYKVIFNPDAEGIFLLYTNTETAEGAVVRVETLVHGLHYLTEDCTGQAYAQFVDPGIDSVRPDVNEVVRDNSGNYYVLDPSLSPVTAGEIKCSAGDIVLNPPALPPFFAVKLVQFPFAANSILPEPIVIRPLE